MPADDKTGETPDEKLTASSEAQDIPQRESTDPANRAVTSPPESLSVVSSLTDSDPPSPAEETKVMAGESPVKGENSCTLHVSAKMTINIVNFLLHNKDIDLPKMRAFADYNLRSA